MGNCPDKAKLLHPQKGGPQHAATTKGQVLATFQDLVDGAQQRSAPLTRDPAKRDASTKTADAAIDKAVAVPYLALPDTTVVQQAGPAAGTRTLPQLLSKATLQLKKLADQLVKRVYSYLYQYAELFEQANESITELQNATAKIAAEDGDVPVVVHKQLLEVSQACWVSNCIPYSLCNNNYNVWTLPEASTSAGRMFDHIAAAP
jgi:hypothetical protein